MNNTLMETYLDKIAEQVIDEDKIVSYKSLSRSLGIHVNTAKQLLYTYLANEKTKDSFQISATYLLAGKVIDGSINISIVNEADLKNAHLNFIKVTSEHVYSVQKGKALNDIKLLHGIVKEPSNLERTDMVIKCCKCILKTKKEVKKKCDFYEKKDENDIKQAFLPEKQAADVVKLNNTTETSAIKEYPLESPKKPSSMKSSSKDHGNISKPGKASIVNMFAKAAQKNSEKSSAAGRSDKNIFKNKPEVDTNINIFTEIKTVSENKAKDVESQVNESCNSSKNESKECLKKKKKGNKRKRIQMLSDSEESNTNDEDEETSSFINLEEDKVQESAPRNKKKKRKVIDRTVMNEDGYLETKKEVVFETDSENELEEIATSSKMEQKLKAEAADNSGKGVYSGKTAKKQSSLLTFFKKN